MATYREIGGQRNYPKPKDFKEGDTMVEGKYRGTINGKFGEQFEFENEEGEVIVLGGWGQLTYKMSFINEGDMVKVVYEGMEKLQTGTWSGTNAHQFTVLRLDGEAIEDLDKDDTGLDSFDEGLGAL